MNLYNISRAGSTLMQDFDRHFGQLINTLATPARPQKTSGIALFENDQHYRIEFEIPGVAIDDVEVAIQDHRLTIRGRRPEPKSGEENWTLHRREVQYGKFERSVELAKDATSDGVDAELANGVLVILVPKSEVAKRRTVSIRNAD